MTLHYKNIQTAIKRKARIQAMQRYLLDHRSICLDTGEVIEYLPDATRDRRKKLSKAKLAKTTSYANRIFRVLGEDRWFYTVNLIDIKRSWGDYGAIFNPRKSKSIKMWVKNNIVGPYYASFEVSAFSGSHIHIACGRQNPSKVKKLLKAETYVYDEGGLVEYLSKPVFNPKDRGSEEYAVMVGAYLLEKNAANFSGKRCPRRSFYRFK